MNTILNVNVVESYLKNLAETLSSTKLYPAAAVWLDKAVMTAKERKVRLVPTDEISIENGQIINCDGQPTHRVEKCYSTLTGYNPEMDVLNLATNEIERVKIPTY